MPPLTSAEVKALTAQVASIIGQTERTAARYLKASNYKVNDAVQLYFSRNSQTSQTHQTHQKTQSAVDAKLDTLFESLRDGETDEKDKLELDSTMAYLANTLRLDIENAELFVFVEFVQAPSIGEITRRGYVEAWKTAGVSLSHNDHRRYLQGLISSLARDINQFRKVYRYAFVAGRERDQKALSLENAQIYWGMLFTAPGMPWRTATHDWLALWQGFLKESWTRSVNKDMWNMTLEFAIKSMADETLSFWNEDGAWPSVIDDFVEWCRKKGVTKGESMDTDGRY